MNYYSIPPLLASILLFLLSVLIIKNKTTGNVYFAFACLSSTIWLFSDFIAFNSSILENIFMWYRLAYVGIAFIPVFFFHYTQIFIGTKWSRNFIKLNYIIGLFFIFLLGFTDFLIKEPRRYFWGYYPIAGKMHFAFVIFFFLIACCLFIQLFNFCFKKKTLLSLIKVQQSKYILAAFIIFTFAFVDFLPNYGIQIYPFGYLPTTLFIAIITFAIIRYRLLDITVALTRTGIFIAVYSLILGLPFILAYSFQSYLVGLFGDKWWLVPMGLLTVLATVGPFIFIYINKKAEDKLLREQRQYQNTLRQASSGMIRVRELRKLLNLIVHVVTKTVRLEFASIFLFDSGNNQYIMVAKRDSSGLPKSFNLAVNSPLIDQLHEKREPLVYEEIQLQAQDNPNDTKMVNLEKQLKEIRAAVVIPSYVGNKMLGFIVLGKKLSGKIFSQDDLNVFSVLANQAALAIENAQFYEDIKETQEQLFQAEKMATVGTMADGLSHQINNRFQALSLITGDSMDILKSTDVSNCSQEVKDSFQQLQYAFQRIQANVMQGGEVVRGLLKYSRPGETGFESIDFNQVIDGALEMVQYKVRLSELDIQRNIPGDLPKIKCNLTQLEEVFFNLIDNAYDAIRERKSVIQDTNFRGKIIISAVQEDSHVRIIFEDNGMGVKDKDKEKLFTPFFTTKSSNKKGTGLGLYVIQKIVGFHEGTIHIDTTYNVGTKFEMTLPLSNI